MTSEAISSKSITIEHIRLVCRRSFNQVKTALEASLPELDPKVAQALAGGDLATVQHFEAHGPKLFRFLARDHGTLLQIAGKQRNAIQYEIGNPITATKMTRHRIGAALYAPLRVALFETESGEVIFEYDSPSSLFGQFGDTRILEVSLYLDDELHKALSAVAG